MPTCSYSVEIESQQTVFYVWFYSAPVETLDHTMKYRLKYMLDKFGRGKLNPRTKTNYIIRIFIFSTKRLVMDAFRESGQQLLPHLEYTLRDLRSGLT